MIHKRLLPLAQFGTLALAAAGCQRCCETTSAPAPTETSSTSAAEECPNCCEMPEGRASLLSKTVKAAEEKAAPPSPTK